VPPADAEEPYDLDVGERRGDGGAVSTEHMWENFQRSRFAELTPLMVEQPFMLDLGDGPSLEGRIDAIFERDDGTWEVVDYKTGATKPDPLQLAIYATDAVARRAPG
jgi:RecB family exonuclease